MKAPIIERLKIAFNCKTARELAKKLGVHETQIARWRRNGFHQSTEKLLNLLLDQIGKS